MNRYTVKNMKDLNQIANSFYQNVVSLTLFHLNRTGGIRIPIEDKMIFKLRDCILYRFDSVLHHWQLLVDTQNKILNDFSENFPENWNDPIIFDKARSTQMYIFDDIMFNAISLFDYFGNMIGYMFKENKKEQLRWNRAYKLSKQNKGNISKYEISNLIIRNHENWVAKLYEYRSSLIHYKIESAEAQQSISFSEGKTNFAFKVKNPKQFIKIFRKLDLINDASDDTHLLDVALKLITKTIECLDEMIICIQKNIPKQVI